MNASVLPALAHAARELTAEIHDGRWRHVVELETRPASMCEALVAELRSRHPGLERAEYEKALDVAWSEYRPAPVRDTVLFWFVGFTFIWAFFVVNPLVKRFVPVWDGWTGLWAYPAVCVAAALYVWRKKKSGRGVLAAINVASGLSWIAFVLWAVRAFARSFWR